MKSLNFLKQVSLAFVILMFCSFNFSNVSDGITNGFDNAEWETCIREATGKIASAYSKSVLSVEYEYDKEDFKVKMSKKKISTSQNLSVKMTIHWSINGTNHYVEGNLKTNSDCCNASWELSKFSSKMYKAKKKINLGCVSGSSTVTKNNMGVGRPFVRKRSKA